MKAHASQPVTYIRLTNGYQVSVDATDGPASSMLEDGQVVTLGREDRDFAITAADLKDAGGIPFEPVRGDQIRLTRNGKTYTYRVELGDTQAAWDWTDSSQTRRKVRTKLVAEA